MQIENNKGPRIEPWGTPKVIVALLEEMFPTDRTLKKDLSGPITFNMQLSNKLKAAEMSI